MAAFRMEHDLIGSKKVPKDAYYGIQTLRAVENFNITGCPSHRKLILAVAMVKKAAAMSNMKLGLLNEKKGSAIIQAADEILDGKFADQFVVDAIQGGAGTSVNMNVNEVIANRAIEILGGEKGDYDIISPNTDVNMSQSTNDVYPTAIRIATISLAKNLLSEMELLKNALLKKADEFDDVVKVGRTQLQDAVPIRLGQEFEAYAQAIGRDLARIKSSLEALHEINLGATAIGTGLNAKVEYIELAIENLRNISGIPLRKAVNLIDATQNTDVLAAFSSTLKILAINLSKIANDLRLMSSGPRAGIAEIKLPAMQPGSSIMPGKVNPVIPEVVNQVAFQVIGNDHTISLAVEAGQLELNAMEPVITYNLLQSIEILTNAIKTFREKCIVGITANRERCQEMVEKSVGIITALIPHIGYEKASQLAKEIAASDETVPELIAKKNLLPQNVINNVLSPKAMTEPGILCG
ncbi:aspartate ammonia-lyase (aspartase) [Tepidanaerobacter acetatoxydans Re1]|uniref:Aspartate ammonia-lyase (Aspartase) n=1 Tax=Tepidanaerobacter acetatoxydans (strain DSM 21804 / JCM 16047 / Re1) TaxID=1209989 RepID=F4LW58_TEPAE|nr:aspartate ammonia-lyase [Tepidanaerobacter acetatoxydans]AEE90834.1 Fumarate hydratase class II [Tepidanaerobacter acetatoxydans Re1]CCP25395.1 aspartate ammonia-lyase (aspartase) [Tepidanaerobacter acetatoxydans Re1]